MLLPRLFTCSFVPLSVIKYTVLAGLLVACQPQNIATNGTPTATTKAITKPAPTPSNDTANLIVTETVIKSSSGANSTTGTTATISGPTIVASVPPQPKGNTASDIQPDSMQPQETVPEIVPEIVPPAPPSPPPEFKPHTVLAKPDSVLLSLLGTADIIRTEGQVKIWQYRLDSCVFDFFLTPENGIYAVRDWAYRASILGTKANELICRRALAKDRMRPASG